MTSDYLELAGAANCCAGTVGLEAVGALNVAAGNAVTEYKELAGVLNQLAGTTGLEATAAANVWAGTTGLELVGALNMKCAGSGTWDPRSLTDLAAWYEPDLDAGLRAVVDMVPDTAVGGAFGTTLASDSFDRADGVIEGTDTDGPTGVDGLTWDSSITADVVISGNLGRVINSNSTRRTIVDAEVRDMVVEATFHSPAPLTSNGTFVLICGSAVNSNNAFEVRYEANTGGTGGKVRLYLNNVVLADTTLAATADTHYQLKAAVWTNRARVWINDVLMLDYTLSAANMANANKGTNAGWALAGNVTSFNMYVDDFWVRTVTPAADFDEDSSAPGDVGLTDVDASITANSLYVSAVDGTGTDGIEATRSGSDIVVTADSGTIATVTDPGSSGDDLRIIRKDTRVWVYSNADLATALTLSAPDAAAASGGYTDGTEAAPPPSVTVFPDLSGQHQHAVQTDDGTDQGAGATTDRRPLLLSNFTDGGTGALVGNGASYLTGPNLGLVVPWSHGVAARLTATNRAAVGSSDNLRWYLRRSSTNVVTHAGNQVSQPIGDGTIDHVLTSMIPGANGWLRRDGVEKVGHTGTNAWIEGFNLLSRNGGADALDGSDDLAAFIIIDADVTANVAALESHLARHTDWIP
ncbi:MAG: hypothetical protein GY679_00835 [Mycoplasma sp.]|nr:hypothetical protein [Mycoplasma sp.]